MKKNVMLKIASVLMVAVLLTTCAISSTFAKYVTSAATKTAEAKVAKWGLEIAATSNDGKIFLDTYYAKNSSSNIMAKAAGTYNVVAPGTPETNNLGTGFGFTISGAPEVSFNLNAIVDIELANWADAAGAYYCPVVFMLGTDEIDIVDINENGSFDLEEYEKSIENAIAKKIFGDDKELTLTNVEASDRVTRPQYSALYAANTNFNENTLGDFGLTWKWEFDPPAETLASGVLQTNEKDSDLGDKAAGSDVPTISIFVEISAEQSAVGVVPPSNQGQG